ncbi:MAG: 50S ribosomal protein L15 [Candidatus Pacebacteria bacterium]|nr:50S ribosomal protein L15 [Candidatus Paceibacterota bacterium]
MQLHQLKPNKKAKKKRIGRGGSHGTTATRGTKGQKSRSGGGKGANFEGNKIPLFRRTPKLRGFKSLALKNLVVNISQIEKYFENGEIVNPLTLLGKGLIVKSKASVKILGNGEVKKKLVFEDCLVSKTAEEKIKKVGGEVRAIISEK